MKEYEMNDVRLMRYFLGIQVKQKKYKIFISQEKNVDDLLKKFSMFNCKSTSTPMRINEKLKKMIVMNWTMNKCIEVWLAPYFFSQTPDQTLCMWLV